MLSQLIAQELANLVVFLTHEYMGANEYTE